MVNWNVNIEKSSDVNEFLKYRLVIKGSCFFLESVLLSLCLIGIMNIGVSSRCLELRLHARVTVSII